MSIYSHLESYRIIEPRIYHLANELKQLLSIIQLEYHGKPVEVNGFSLKDLSKWQNYSTDNAMNAIIPISGNCNGKCSFCFEQGIPFPREHNIMSLEEAKTRLKFYSASSGNCLFTSSLPHMETFVNINAIDIIEMARNKDPTKLFCITTNGSYLDESTVNRLATLKPLILKLSLNVFDFKLHKELIGIGKRSYIALNAPVLLQKYAIPFIGSIVAWPTLDIASITNTILYYERCQAYAIRVRLPLIHKWFKKLPKIDLYSHWTNITELIISLRNKISVPLLVEPPIFSVNPIIPEIDGVIINSPAHRSGIRTGDIIQSINQTPILTRTESEGLLHYFQSINKPVDIVAKRGSEVMQFSISCYKGSDDTYPYIFNHSYAGENYGIFHVYDFRLDYIRNIFDIIDRYEAKHVLIFSSHKVASIFEVLLKNIPEFAKRLDKISIYIDKSDNSFGGNFDILDSCMVNDYVFAIKKLLNNGMSFDLILIPKAFGTSWGIDLAGNSFTLISTMFGIPVELIDWYIIYGREV